MEDTGDMVDYSFDSLDKVFSTMGEMAPIGNVYLRMEQMMGGLVPSTSDIKGHPLIGGIQLLPFSTLDPVVSELSPSEAATISISEHDPHLLPAPGLLGTKSFSWLPDISDFPVSTRVLPVGTSPFPSLGSNLPPFSSAPTAPHLGPSSDA